MAPIYKILFVYRLGKNTCVIPGLEGVNYTNNQAKFTVKQLFDEYGFRESAYVVPPIKRVNNDYDYDWWKTMITLQFLSNIRAINYTSHKVLNLAGYGYCDFLE